ncbi:MAG: PilZ domain-containing protein [Terracidiphilus sp.]|jgi:hypothetical protein
MAQLHQLEKQQTGLDASMRSVDRSSWRTDWPEVKGRIEPGQICAYNQTRESFLGLQVIAGDFSLASLNEWIKTLTPNSGGGIWMIPFRGVLATEVRTPLDLLYLDQDCKVLDTVEFFPTYRVSASRPPAASVLALPSHSIFSSQTQPGDRLVLCSPEEMEWRLEQVQANDSARSGAGREVSTSAQGPTLVREMPKKVAGPAMPGEDLQRISSLAVIREMPRRAEGAAVLEPAQLPVQTETPELRTPQAEPVVAPAASPVAAPSGKPTTPKRGWLERWLFPEPADPRRRAPRKPVAGLTAHFFTGGAPQAHEIRDISATGLYVVTSERWYPGTLIRMTLSKPDIGQAPSERSITVHAKSVRWGNDGVGLEFVLEAPRKASKYQASPFDPVDSAHLDSFLKRLTGGSA